MKSYVEFGIAKMRFVLDCDYTLELVKDFECDPIRLPKAPEKLEGLVDHRGDVLAVVDFRKLLDMPSYQQGVKEMSEFVAQREQDHVSWLEDLKTCAQTGANFTKAIDPTLCAFGKWYESTKSNPGQLDRLTNGSALLNHLFEAFDIPHKHIHSIASRVLALAESGQIEEATAIVDDTWTNELAAMRELFKQFNAAFAAEFRPTAIVVRVEGRRVALLVDTVKSIRPFAETDFTPLSDMISAEASALGTDAVLIDEVPFIRVLPHRIVAEIGDPADLAMAS